jgi:hypothetical protein
MNCSQSSWPTHALRASWASRQTSVDSSGAARQSSTHWSSGPRQSASTEQKASHARGSSNAIPASPVPESGAPPPHPVVAARRTPAQNTTRTIRRCISILLSGGPSPPPFRHAGPGPAELRRQTHAIRAVFGQALSTRTNPRDSESSQRVCRKWSKCCLSRHIRAARDDPCCQARCAAASRGAAPAP